MKDYDERSNERFIGIHFLLFSRISASHYLFLRFSIRPANAFSNILCIEIVDVYFLFSFRIFLDLVAVCHNLNVIYSYHF